MGQHFDVFLLSTLLGFFLLEISTDQYVLQTKGKEVVEMDLAAQNAGYFYRGAIKFFIAHGLRIFTGAVVFFSSLESLLLGNGRFSALCNLVAYCVGLFNFYNNVWPGTWVAIGTHPGSKAMEHFETMYPRRLSVFFVFGSVLLSTLMSKKLKRPEIIPLGLAFGLNLQNCIFDLPAILNPYHRTYGYQAVVNNTIHVDGFIHTLVVPGVILGTLGIVGYRVYKERSPIDVFVLLLLLVAGPGYILHVEPREMALLDACRKAGTMKLFTDETREAITVFGIGHVYLCICCLVGAFMQYLALTRTFKSSGTKKHGRAGRRKAD